MFVLSLHACTELVAHDVPLLFRARKLWHSPCLLRSQVVNCFDTFTCLSFLLMASSAVVVQPSLEPPIGGSRRLKSMLNYDAPLKPPTSTGDADSPPNIPESARKFFASISSPTEILSSKLVPPLDGTEVIEGGFNFAHFLNLDTGESGCPFPFVLRFPIDPINITRWQTCTAVGCMLYCQRHPDLNIPTPAIYAYSCACGSEFIAMEYIDGDTLSSVWLDIPKDEQEDVLRQVAEIMHTMRSKTSFKAIGGISPDGSSCPLVDGVDATCGRVCFP